LATLNNFLDILFISIGAVFGANTRFIIFQKLKEININSSLIILAINTFSSFLVGLFIPMLSQVRFVNLSSQLVSFVLIGFLGSFSTFSTFVYDLFVEFNFFKALKYFSLSFSLGIIAITLGSLMAN
tara:strand:- start:988 stop:1368 length:381 start_codon:yes stop_codon:yes gene_type:complete